MLRHYEREARNQSRDAVMNQIADIKPDASSRRSPYFSEEHEMLRAQVRRFVETEIKPHALAWEEQGYVPREVLRRMGSLGFFGIRYPARYGGSELDALATVVLAEELGRSTFSGVAITALVHSDMASIHVFRSGSEAQKDKWMPGIIAGDVITAVAVTEPDAGSDVKSIRTFAPRGRRLRPQRRQDVYHQRRARQPLLRGGEDRQRRRAEPLDHHVSC
jgi:alkylation response protein AidB-like acyl-CoA dehydrogenase